MILDSVKRSFVRRRNSDFINLHFYNWLHYNGIVLFKKYKIAFGEAKSSHTHKKKKNKGRPLLGFLWSGQHCTLMIKSIFRILWMTTSHVCYCAVKQNGFSCWLYFNLLINAKVFLLQFTWSFGVSWLYPYYKSVFSWV